jgi:protease I
MTKKILVLAGDFSEELEVFVPYHALKMIGYQVDVVCPDKKKGDSIQMAIHDFGEW